MILVAHAQAVEPGFVQLWVGMFGVEKPPPPTFTIRRLPATPIGNPTMTAIRDQTVGPTGAPFNHRGLFRFAVPNSPGPIDVEVRAGSQSYSLITKVLPFRIPSQTEGRFNVLLCSCYYQPEDEAGRLGSIVSQIPVSLDLTVMAGDQVYLDLPLFEDLPDSEPGLSKTLAEKYVRNWASTSLGIAGLQPLLRRAPVVMVPDDHEFWNNYPFPQKQLPNLWSESGRTRWRLAAQRLYEDFQLSNAPEKDGAFRLDIDPLRMLFVDMRCSRRDDLVTLMNANAKQGLKDWVDALIEDKHSGRPGIGVLCSGQALFVKPAEERKVRTFDAEMANFADFALVEQALGRLADDGIPVLYLTGDVHWSRVASAVDGKRADRSILYEVVVSPSRLIRTPIVDRLGEAKSAIKGAFGSADPWPRHADREPVPPYFGAQKRFRPEDRVPSGHAKRGDQVAVLSFSRAGSGVDFDVTYHPIHADPELARPRTLGPYSLRVM